ncbi:hypothetical protein HYV50_04110 [Candidatus Pacearchaeota archaeon]|nr:hypothetical protein [Candidatus Pacearchaeota archaeon]
MGKNRDRKSLIRVIVNLVVHEIVAKHTNKPESTYFLNSEIIEYRSQAEKTSEKHNWSMEDKGFVEKTVLKMIREKLFRKYSDVRYSEQEVIKKLKELVKEIM